MVINIFFFAKINIDKITIIMKLDVKDFIFIPAAHGHVIIYIQ